MMMPLASATVLFLAALPLASAQGMKNMDMKDMPMKSDSATVHKATGVVKVSRHEEKYRYARPRTCRKS